LAIDSLPPNARLQHVLTVEVEAAEAEALLLDSMAVRAPPSGGWHDPAHAPALAAYAAAVAFESSCAIARVQLVAWPCREYILDNGQFRTMISAHLGLLPPILQPLVGKPIRALRADGNGWRELGLVDCRATNLQAACFTGDASYTPRHDAFRDRVYAELRRAGFTAMRECSHVVLAGMSAGLRALLDVATDASKACRDAARAAYPSSGASEEERTARALAAAAATRQAVDAGLSAARVEHAITHMRGIRPDIVANDTMNASARMLLEAKTAALCPSNYGTRFAANGDTWMEARARKAVVERDMAAKKLDDVVFPNVQPPPMATQLQNLGGVSAIVVGAFCEHNDQVHSLVNLLAAKAGPGAETETGLDNKSAVAFEKHRIRLRMAAGAWRDYHESIHARLPFVHSCTADAAVQEDLRRADERQERAARNLVQSFTFGAPGVGGGHRHARRGRPSAREFLLSRAAVA